MEDIVDYSKKLQEEKNKQKKNFIIISVVVAFLAFCIGFYASYAFNNSSYKGSHKDKLNTVYEILTEEWYYGKDYEDLEKGLIDKAIYGMLDTQKDPFTQYLTSLGSLATSYEGLGITVSEYKEYFIINEVASKTNIDEGLKKGDILISIDGQDLANKSSEDIKTLIENKKSVDLVVLRGNASIGLKGYITTYTPITVFKDFSSEEMAYIQITEFAQDTSSYLDLYLKEAKQEGYNKLILDLRDNPGGYITSVVECADLFMGKGEVVLTTKNKAGDSYSYKTKGEGKYDFNKIIVLMNGGSASGAEALSAALNDNMGDKVQLVGVKTYGKGSAQKTIYFTDGTYFHYTYALWYRPSGETINGDGVYPEDTYAGSGIHLLAFNKNITLKKDDYGTNVYNLQMIMKELGYYNETVNSYFGEDLVQSLKEYQNDRGITQSGELDSLTIRYILADYYDSRVNDYDNEINYVINAYGE